ncbi:hypothetical protein B0H19DRAFT_1097555 [Mycena capillaripes]|nr:hypothetical protein B0H19DRAFT_1097555 [Mycena capillaripes]
MHDQGAILNPMAATIPPPPMSARTLIWPCKSGGRVAMQSDDAAPPACPMGRWILSLFRA